MSGPVWDIAPLCSACTGQAIGYRSTGCDSCSVLSEIKLLLHSLIGCNLLVP